MEWMNRGGNAPQNNSQQPNTAPAPAAHRPAARGKSVEEGKALRAASVALLFAVTILLVSVIAYLAIIKPAKINQGKHVDTTKYQAVFLNGGQVYFGKVTTTNSEFLKLEKIYYLRVNQQVQPNGQSTAGDVQLVKLGCELHGPEDQMVINNDQVIFWENLKEDGQVAKAVAKYVSENPDGQKCQTGSTQQSTTPATDETEADTKKTTN